MTTIRKEIVSNVTVIDDIKCDRCGGSCKRPGLKTGLTEFVYGSFGVVWGYASKRDCTRWDADLCEECCEAFQEWLTQSGGKVRVRGY